MEDNEIIKALNGADGLGHISIYCADNNGKDVCSIKVVDILDLINRQKAQIERLQKFLDDKCDRCIAKERTEAVKEFAERLKEKFACLEYVIQTNRKTLPIERVKAEVDAVLQNGCSNVVDKILKEMVGEG